MKITGREELEVIFSKRRQKLSQEGKLCDDSQTQCRIIREEDKS